MSSSFGFTNRRRTSKCICCGCVWLLVLVIVQQCGGNESEERHVNYTTPKLDLSYRSSTEINAKAMEQLYYVTNFFIDLIQKKELYPEDLLEDEYGTFTTDKLISDWPLLARHYAGVVSVAILGIIFVVLMPLVALVFCCCRCAGRCGGRAQPFEKRRDSCRRVTLGIILSAVAIIILFGVVCAFVTNEYMEDGIKNLPSKLNVAVDDAHLYLNNTVLEMKSLLLDNFMELEVSLENDLNDASVNLTEQLKNKTSLGALDSLTRFGEGLQSIAQDVNKIHNLTEELKNDANEVNLILSDIKKNLTDELHNCLKRSSCSETYYQVQKMSNPANFSELPNITEKIGDVNTILDIETGINNGKTAYENIQKNITGIVDTHRPEILQTLRQAGDGIKEKSTDVNNLVNNMTVVMDREAKPFIKDIDGYIKEYSQYRYYADISVSSVMLLILLCITLGLFYGFCGKRPDSGYDEDCCNKATGASFLMFGVYVMFIFSAVLMLITLAHFLLGVTAEKGICQSLRQPEDSQLLTVLTKEKIIDIEYTASNTVVNLNISTIISSCHANDSIYNVMQVSNALNISEVLSYPQKYGILDKIKSLKENINISVNFELLNETTKEKLIQLGESSLDLKPLEEVLSSVDRNNSLLTLANSLNETANITELNDHNIQKSLRSYSEKLRKLHNETIQEMLLKAAELNETAHSLKEDMKLFENVNKTLKEIEEVQTLLNSNSITDEMSQLVEVFANGTMEKVNGYLRRVVDDMTTNVGSCEPLSRIYNSSLVFTCNDILDPFNGFWASIGWCLVLFIPAIILSVKLASLYRKSESYHAAIPDTEYLYDAYADRDNIPLANGPDKKNHHRRYNETYDNSSGYMGDYSSHMGRGDRERRERGGSAYHPEDARYNDMAPKHWDYSNGALPRYHSPPLSTEYERPPPYYYPGPGSFLERLKGKIRKTPKGNSAEGTSSEKLDQEKYYTLSGLPKLTKDMLGSVKRRIISAPRMKVMLDSFKELPRLSFGALKFPRSRTSRASEFA